MQCWSGGGEVRQCRAPMLTTVWRLNWPISRYVSNSSRSHFGSSAVQTLPAHPVQASAHRTQHLLIPAAMMFPMTDGQFQLVYNILSFSLASMMASTLFLWMRLTRLVTAKFCGCQIYGLRAQPMELYVTIEYCEFDRLAHNSCISQEFNTPRYSRASASRAR